MRVKLPTFLLKYKLFGSANQEIAEYKSSLAQISHNAHNSDDNWTSNVHDLELGQLLFCNVLSKYPSVKNLRAELVPSHGV